MPEKIIIQEVSKSFGGLLALNSVSLEIIENQDIGILGTNGAGKTTLFNIISGATSVDSGKIFYNDKDITNLSPVEISKLGINRTFQKSMLFENLTIEENIILGLLKSINFNLSANIIKLKKKHFHEIANYIQKFNLPLSILKQFPCELSYGIKRIVEIIRIIISDPKIILLDEPTAGLNKEESLQLLNILKQVKNENTATFVVIEHNLNFLFQMCTKFYYMDNGVIKFSGNKNQLLLNNPDFIKLLY